MTSPYMYNLHFMFVRNSSLVTMFSSLIRFHLLKHFNKSNISCVEVIYVGPMYIQTAMVVKTMLLKKGLLWTEINVILEKK